MELQKAKAELLEAVQERDVDLILLEEFHCSESFRNWFLEKTLRVKGKFITAQHSITHPALGESDLEVLFEVNGKTVCVMIENKIGAMFQPNQPQRYFERGKEHVLKGKCSEYHTVLVAPKKYLEKQEIGQFDFVIPYEDLCWFFESGDSLRNTYKSKIIPQAIEESRRGYRPVKNELVTTFWQDYYRVICEALPELEMKEPGIKPVQSSFVYLNLPFLEQKLQKSIKIVNKLDKGNADLQLEGKAGTIGHVRRILEGTLGGEMSLVTAGKSAAVRIKVPKINLKEYVAGQEKQVKAGLDADKKLAEWAKKNANRLEELYKLG